MSRLQLLEEFSLQDAEVRITPPVGVQRLVAFLALRGPTHRCVVAGTLWPEVPEAQARANLRTGVWRVNRVLPGLVGVADMSLSLSPTLAIDSVEQGRFATRVLRGCGDGGPWVDEGLGHLRRGQLLPGWYDDWVVFERERLHQLRLHALERVAALLTRRGDLGTALELALEAVRAEPLRETATVVLMSVYLAQGRVSDATACYDTFSEQFRRELGLGPSPALARLVAPPSPQAREHPRLTPR